MYGEFSRNHINYRITINRYINISIMNLQRFLKKLIKSYNLDKTDLDYNVRISRIIILILLL